MRLAPNGRESPTLPPVIKRLKQAVESRHGGTATFVQSVAVQESNGSEILWAGVVHAFDLSGQPDGAFRAYIWLREQENDEPQLFSVLHGPDVCGPAAAARAVHAGAGREFK